MKFTNTQKLETKVRNVNGLRIITIGGTERVNKNLTIYEYKESMIAVDCGIGFPDIFDMPGVDSLLPDFTYLLENSHKLKGIFITHAHEDHVGAVPNLLSELPDTPIFGSKLVGEFLKVKLSEKRYKEQKETLKFHLMEPGAEEVNLGDFRISSVRLNHSVPEALGYAIRTNEGLFLHVAEYKFDENPVLDKPMDPNDFKMLGDEGVMCLLTDCLLFSLEGETKSESTLSETFRDLFVNAGDKQIFVTTVSSNISRMNQIMKAAVDCGRKVVASGRSVEQMFEVAKRLGYLPFGEEWFVSEKDSVDYLSKDLVYIIAGCYGQPGSSLGRLSRKEHELFQLEPDALVIFSGDPAPPGADIMTEKVQDALTLLGAEVIYGEIQENLHVSGHGLKGDTKKMISLTRPTYLIPLGGSITKMRNFTNILKKEMNIDKNRVFECLEGDSVVFSNGTAHKGQHEKVEYVYVDSGYTTALNPIVISDRAIMSDDGVFVVVIPHTQNGDIVSSKLEVITRGFIYVKDSQDLMNKSKQFIRKKISKRLDSKNDLMGFKRKIESDVEFFLRKETGMKPMVIVHFLSI